MNETENKITEAAVQTAKPKKQWYAWVIFAVCFLMIFVALGFGSSTKGTFLTAICGQLGLDRAKFTINDSMRFITTAIMALFLGKTVEKIGLRWMAGLGFLFLTLSFTIYSLANDYWQFYIGGALLGAGLCWTTTSMVGYLVENWFSNGKGTIMGILLAANGLGGVVSEFVVTKLVYGMDGALTNAESHWRLAYRVIAIMFVVVGVLAFILIRNKPQDIGTEPMWQDKTKKKKRGMDWVGYTEKEVFQKPFFWISAVATFMTGMVLQSMVNISKPYMYDLGMSKDFVIAVFASHSAVLMLAKTLTGISYDTLGMRKTHFFCSLAAAVSMFSLFMLTPASKGWPFVYSIVSSFGLPLETVIIPLIVSYMFGKKAYKSMFGYFYALNAAGYAVGVPIANLFYEKQGTYKNIVLIMMIIILVMLVVQQISMAMADKSRDKKLAELAAVEVKNQ